MKQFKTVNNNSDCDILYEFSYISSENFYEKNTVISPKAPVKMFINDQKSIQMRPLQESNRNTSIELIDLTGC